MSVILKEKIQIFQQNRRFQVRLQQRKKSGNKKYKSKDNKIHFKVQEIVYCSVFIHKIQVLRSKQLKAKPGSFYGKF